MIGQIAGSAAVTKKPWVAVPPTQGSSLFLIRAPVQAGAAARFCGLTQSRGLLPYCFAVPWALACTHGIEGTHQHPTCVPAQCRVTGS